MQEPTTEGFLFFLKKESAGLRTMFNNWSQYNLSEKQSYFQKLYLQLGRLQSQFNLKFPNDFMRNMQEETSWPYQDEELFIYALSSLRQHLSGVNASLYCIENPEVRNESLAMLASVLRMIDSYTVRDIPNDPDDDERTDNGMSVCTPGSC